MYINAYNRGSTMYVRTVDGDFKFNPPVNLYQANPEGTFESVRGKKLVKREFSTITEARSFVKQYDKMLDLYGQDNFLQQVINENYAHTAQPTKDQVRIHSLDIEVDVPDGHGFPHPREHAYPVNALAITDNMTGKVFALGLGHWSPLEAVKRGELDQETADRTSYYACNTEEELLTRLIAFWKEFPPHIITGWNSNGFDMPYLYLRIKKLLGETNANKLSPWGSVKTVEKTFKGQTNINVKIAGVALLDYMELYKTFTYKIRDSYKLNAIASIHLNRAKISYEEEKSLFTLAANNFQKFISYNILDAVLIDELDEVLKLLQLAMNIAWKAQINYEDVFSPIKTWDALCCNALLAKGVIPPLSDYGSTGEPFEGGYVKKPEPGLYKSIFSFDLESLYPSIIIQWNIGPDTIIEGSERGDIREDILSGTFKSRQHSTAANGTEYDNTFQSFLSEIMLNLKKDRKSAKKKMFEWKNNKDHPDADDMIVRYHTEQLALKILLNSGYGALASAYFRFFDIRLAEAITLTGQTVVRYIEDKINVFLNSSFGNDVIKDYCIAIDTDSVYFTVDDFMSKYVDLSLQEYTDLMDKMCKGIEKKIIEPSFVELFNQLKCYMPQMYMDREVIATNGFWTSKKHYALNVMDNEGVRNEKPELKVMGLSLIQSRTPEWVRDKLKKVVGLILNSDDPDRVPNFINETWEEFQTLSPNDIAFNVKVGQLNKYEIDHEPYYDQGTQAQLRAAILHNKLTETHTSIPKLNQGETVKWTWLQQPNPIHEDVIAFDTFLPEEFGLDDYVCYNTQFDKTFRTPLTDICEVVGLKYENRTELDDFFS